MINLLHLIALGSGLLAYYFSDVSSDSAFTNTFLPFIVLVSFIYGVIVTINIFYKLRHKSTQNELPADLLLASLKTTGAVKTDVANDADKSIDDLIVEKKYSAHSHNTKTESEPVIKSYVDDQGEVNEQEWDNPENWGGTNWFDLYFSQKDSRVWVPKRIPILGKTLNLAKPASAYWLATISILFIVLGVGLAKFLF